MSCCLHDSAVDISTGGLVGFSILRSLGNLLLAVRGSCMDDEHLFAEQPLNETRSFPLDVSEERKSIEGANLHELDQSGKSGDTGGSLSAFVVQLQK